MKSGDPVVALHPPDGGRRRTSWRKSRGMSKTVASAALGVGMRLKPTRGVAAKAAAEGGSRPSLMMITMMTTNTARAVGGGVGEVDVNLIGTSHAVKHAAANDATSARRSLAVIATMTSLTTA